MEKVSKMDYFLFIINKNTYSVLQFAAVPTSFAIKSKVYFLTHQYLIIKHSQSKTDRQIILYDYI